MRFPGGAKDYRAKGKDNAIVTPCRSVRGSTLGERKKRGGKKREKKKKKRKAEGFCDGGAAQSKR